MNDISQTLLNAIEKSYQSNISSDRRIGNILARIQSGKATYEDAFDYANELGYCLEEAFRSNISDDILPNGKMYYNIAEKLITPMVQENYSAIATQCLNVQNSLNANAGLSMKAVASAYSPERTEGIVNYISSSPVYSEREKSFLDSLSTNARSIVDQSVHDNADLQYRNGMNPKIIRIAGSSACRWCRQMAGTYNYGDVKDTGNDVFRRHENCSCMVVYDPGDGSGEVQDVWTKYWEDDALVEQRRKFSVSKRKVAKKNSDKSAQMNELLNIMKTYNVSYRKVSGLSSKLSEDEIIVRISGGDNTTGSCSSLAFSYIGEKCGYDVLDFRGGTSQKVFSTTSYIKKIAALPGIRSSTTEVVREAKETWNIVSNLSVGKEYYLASGKHAAIVKNTAEGVQYLELQSPKDSGWHELSYETLKYRFGCRVTPDRVKIPDYKTVTFKRDVVLMEVDSFAGNEEFRELLGYINTAEDQQKKSGSGYAK